MFSKQDEARLTSLLESSLGFIRQELNELDWKLTISPDNERLKEHLSAFANLHGGGFLVFGVSDQGDIVGVRQAEAKAIQSKLGSIAREGLEPSITLDGKLIKFRGQEILAIRIPESPERPVRKRGKSIEASFIRAGGQTRKMSDLELRRSLMTSRSLRFEELMAAIPAEISEDLKQHFRFDEVFRRLKRTASINDWDLEYLHSLKLLARQGGDYTPTNLGVLIATNNFSSIPGYERFGVRVTKYKGSSRLNAVKDTLFPQGFAVSLDHIVEFIVSLLPVNEVMKRATRLNVPAIPEVAIREILGNAIVHRDYARSDAFTVVDVFDDRIEVINPGGLLPDLPVDRLIDYPSRTRNEVLADMMKKLDFIEERGSGIDRATAAMEAHGLPPLKFISNSDHFHATLYAPRAFSEMGKEERIEAVYQHACLNSVMSGKTTNASIRERFKFDERQSTKVSRLINDALEAQRIKVANPEASPRYIHYLPYWA
jgi:ATP-dependent DNA helicase RecG